MAARIAEGLLEILAHGLRIDQKLINAPFAGALFLLGESRQRQSEQCSKRCKKQDVDVRSHGLNPVCGIRELCNTWPPGGSDDW